MRTRLLAVTIALVLGTGCSAINDFGRFMFDGDGDAGVDSGMVLPEAGVDAGTDAATPDAGPDATTPDGGVDGGTDGGIDAGPRPPTAIVQTAGGDTVLENSTHRLRVSVGAPVPLGDEADSTHRLRVGPQVR